MQMAPVVWILAIAVAAGAAGGDPVVKNALGTITGKSESFEGAEVESFLGIPYGKPPVGDLRFAPPQAFGPVGELNATRFSSVCLQPDIGVPRPDTKQSEDCLYLNVFRKAGTKEDSKKPVLFVIHGGAFSSGAASDEIYNGIPMAALGDVIVVSIEYRLGVFGFADMKDLAPGNLGLHDQVLALEWVRDNVAAFGGDPDKVSLMGVSAGAQCVGALLISPATREKKLFRQAIMDGGVMSRSNSMTQDHTLKRMKEIAAAVGCETEGEKMLSCLRKANASALLEASFDPKISPIYTFMPTMDGKFLPTDLSKDTKENADKFPDVRVLIGVAKNEGTMFAAMYPAAQTLKTKEEFVALCQNISGGFQYPIAFDQKDVKDALIQGYFEKSTDHFNAVSDFIGDGSFTCPVDTFVRSYAKTHKDVFVFKLDRIMKSQFPRYGRFDPKLAGAFHGSPLMHMLGAPLATSDEVRKGPLEAEDRQFIKDTMKMTADFMKCTGVPQLRGVAFPKYSEGEGVLVIDDTPSVGKSIVDEARCQKVFPFLSA